MTPVRVLRAAAVALALGFLSGWTGPALSQDGPLHPADARPLHGAELMRPAPAFGDLDEIRARRTLRILVPYSRTTFFFDRGEPRGFVHDIFQAYGRTLNARLRATQRVRLAFVPVPRDRLIPWLLEGRGDVAAGHLTRTPGREALVDFAAPIKTGVSEIAVTRRDGPQPTTTADLSGLTVHVRRSSSYHDSLVALNGRLEAEGRPPVRIVPAAEWLEDEDLLEQLQEGLFDAAIVDDDKRTLFAAVFPDLAFHGDVRVREGGEIAWAVRKGSPQLIASLSAFVAQAKRGSRLLSSIDSSYYVDNRWIRRPPKGDRMAEYAAVLAHFRTFGSSYGMEWMRLLAQGFQESGLDQTARGPTGAVGIMQILPTTAAAHPIGVPDVFQAEANVEAGAKYMRHLIDTYLNDPGLDADERFRLALASYNAGPNRVATLRRRAAAAGLDPNVWYGNVEVMAAKHVGQETVAYVSNIEKYLFAFRAALALEDLRLGGERR